ncbi:hypothetical protein DPMN_062939 [Dreissena polymorpha]|uniref:Uncharacterized protein n=1 Tax=Dreissena polymorpha TaxID=45954 RepID=A0A9D4HIK9_DREPO|nr:hypothetical protein DPMN_062939 [Dreissena polymorpha]
MIGSTVNSVQIIVFFGNTCTWKTITLLCSIQLAEQTDQQEEKLAVTWRCNCGPGGKDGVPRSNRICSVNLNASDSGIHHTVMAALSEAAYQGGVVQALLGVVFLRTR